jgi:uncharacterized protein (DUF2237 family)
MPEDRKVLGEKLDTCSIRPMTGFYRTGCCETGAEDVGAHVVCIEVTKEFLAFSRTRGNDLSTPVPEMGFPGLQPGDRWCLCATRWKEALDAGMAPRVVLRATHEEALDYLALADLKMHALDLARLTSTTNCCLECDLLISPEPPAVLMRADPAAEVRRPACS